MFTVTVLTSTDDGVDPPHPNPEHQHRLVEVWRRLGPHHALAYCGGCRWFVRWPTRPTATKVGTIGEFAHVHMTSAHFTDLVAGRATIDPDLVDGGRRYLGRRFSTTVGR